MGKITHALQKVKNSCDYGISEKVILEATNAVGHKYRERTLGPIQTIYLFLAQILHGNEACSSLRHSAGMTCSVVAYGALGRYTEAIGAHKNAIAVYKKYCPFKSNYAKAYCDLGFVYRDSKQNTLAITAFEKAITIESDGEQADLARKEISELSTTQPANK